MDIQTKFNIKDMVFILHNSKIICTSIQQIKINITEYGGVKEIYFLESDNLNKPYWSQELFKTKEELIASL